MSRGPAGVAVLVQHVPLHGRGHLYLSHQRVALAAGRAEEERAGAAEPCSGSTTPRNAAISVQLEGEPAPALALDRRVPADATPRRAA